MVYACAGRNRHDEYGLLPPCGHEELYYLGIGVEGPPEIRKVGLEGWEPASIPFDELDERLVAHICSVPFAVIPSPFVAGSCPQCYGGTMQHARFQDDVTFEDYQVPPSGTRYFRVPDEDAAEVSIRSGYGGGELVVKR
jgi:hypothetical protein